jgi:hypothetical protein
MVIAEAADLIDRRACIGTVALRVEPEPLGQPFEREAVAEFACAVLIREHALLFDGLLTRESPYPFDADRVFHVVWLGVLTQRRSLQRRIEQALAFPVHIHHELGDRLGGLGYSSDADIPGARYIDEHPAADEQLVKRAGVAGASLLAFGADGSQGDATVPRTG